MNLIAPFIPVSEICLDCGLKKTSPTIPFSLCGLVGKQISSPSSFLLFSCSIRKERKEQVRKDKGWKTGREGETRAEAGREGERAREEEEEEEGWG